MIRCLLPRPQLTELLIDGDLRNPSAHERLQVADRRVHAAMRDEPDQVDPLGARERLASHGAPRERANQEAS